MKNNRTPLRLATGLLLAAAAFPLTPLAAQDAGTQAQTPAPAPVQSAPPQDAQTPTPAPAPAREPPIIDAPPVQAQETPANEDPAPAAEAPAERPQAQTPPPARARPRAAPQPRAQAAPVRRTAPAAVAAPTAPAVATAPLPAPAPVEEEFAPPAETTAELPATVAPAPAPEALPADPAPAAENQQGSDMAPLLLVGLLALAGIAAALYFARRRRRVDQDSYNAYPVHQEEAAAPMPFERPAPEPAPAPLAATVPAAAPVAAAAMAAPIAAAAPDDSGRPWIELLMRPVRAGVGEEDARVEFELCVDNKGSAPAEDVRISTFMLAAGSPEETQMERSLIEHAPEARLPDAIDPGEAKRIASAVALPREGLHDAILPVVVADARYRLPDGSEGRTSVSYAVGVPWGGDLAHFDVENPSGLHEGVEARLRGEPQQV